MRVEYNLKTVVVYLYWINQPLLFPTEHSPIFHTKPGLKVDYRSPEVHRGPALNSHPYTGSKGCRSYTVISIAGYECHVLNHYHPSRA
jgi:hypothetical protein